MKTPVIAADEVIRTEQLTKVYPGDIRAVDELDLEEADKLCDRVAIMDHGKILALDTPSGLKASIVAETVVRVVIDELRPAGPAARHAFTGLLLRDLHVLRKNAVTFAIRTIMHVDGFRRRVLV